MCIFLLNEDLNPKNLQVITGFRRRFYVVSRQLWIQLGFRFHGGGLLSRMLVFIAPRWRRKRGTGHALPMFAPQTAWFRLLFHQATGWFTWKNDTTSIRKVLLLGVFFIYIYIYVFMCIGIINTKWDDYWVDQVNIDG